MTKKYYVFTLSTNLANGTIFNNTLFTDGEGLPSWSEIQKSTLEIIREKGFEPKEDSTIILFMQKLTKQEYDALYKSK